MLDEVGMSGSGAIGAVFFIDDERGAGEGDGEGDGDGEWAPFWGIFKGHSNSSPFVLP